MPDEHTHTARDEPDRSEDDETDGTGKPELRGQEPGVETRRDPNRMLGRRSPVGESDSALVSRDYQPRVGGPELVASWPLGPTPAQTSPGDEDWTVTSPDYVTLQKNCLQIPYVAPVECSILYLNVCGRGRTSSDDTVMTLHLATDHLTVDGEPYETTVELSAPESEYFVSPMVEIAPDTGDYDPGGDIVASYTFEAAVSGGTGYLDQGTAVQLWSE